jgi:c-di-GMP-binding flagellar brake protein YcgR
MEDTALFVNVPWSRTQPLPHAGEEIFIQQTYSDTGFGAPRYPALVRQMGIRSMTAEYVGTDTGSLPQLHTNVVASFFLNDQLYTFESVVQKYRTTASGAMVYLQRPRRVIKVQRRFSYRVPVETRTTYRFQWPGPSFPEPLHAKIVNLSEGGMLITTNGPVYENAMVTINVPCGKEGDTMDVTAEILEVKEDPSLRQETKVARLRFDGSNKVSLTDQQRTGIVTYLFEEQRLMLQARRLLNPPKKRS